MAIGNLGWLELAIVLTLLIPIAMPFYVGWRYVRALERRSGDRRRIDDLTAEIRALGVEVSLMADELVSLRDEESRGTIGPQESGRGG